MAVASQVPFVSPLANILNKATQLGYEIPPDRVRLQLRYFPLYLIPLGVRNFGIIIFVPLGINNLDTTYEGAKSDPKRGCNASH
jgi:hypothetical protein